VSRMLVGNSGSLRTDFMEAGKSVTRYLGKEKARLSRGRFTRKPGAGSPKQACWGLGSAPVCQQDGSQSAATTLVNKKNPPVVS
jgi:hypothetical protein